MSVWEDVKHTFKKGLLFVYGPADLDESVDPGQKLDREHQNRVEPDPRRAGDWDRG